MDDKILLPCIGGCGMRVRDDIHIITFFACSMKMLLARLGGVRGIQIAISRAHEFRSGS